MTGKQRDRTGRFVKDIDAAHRAAEACRLRAIGLPYREIAAQVGYGDAAAAYNAVKAALVATVQEPADELRTLELERLDRLLVKAWAVLDRSHVAHSGGKLVMMVVDGEEVPMRDDAPTLNAIDRVLKIMERRAKLLGLDAPTKIEQAGQVRYEIVGVDLDQLC